MKIRLLLVLMTLGFCARLAVADQVILKNGDRLTGTITSMAGGNLVMHTAEAGDVTIDSSDIDTFSSNAPVTVKLQDGTEIVGTISPVQNGMIKLNRGSATDFLTMNEIKAINPPPPTVWNANVKFGGLLVRGNTDTDSVNFGFDVKRTTEKDVFDFNGTYLYGRTRDRLAGTTATTADSWTLEAKYSYNLNPRTYAFLDVPLLHDRLAEIYLRITPSAGIGYKFFDQPHFKLAGEFGVAGIIEQYSNGTPDSDTFSLVLAYHLTKDINDKVSVFSDLSYYPGVINVSLFVVDFDAGLKVVLTKHFFAELRGDVDYNNTPAIGALHTDSKISLDLGYTL